MSNSEEIHAWMNMSRALKLAACSVPVYSDAITFFSTKPITKICEVYNPKHVYSWCVTFHDPALCENQVIDGWVTVNHFPFSPTWKYSCGLVTVCGHTMHPLLFSVQNMASIENNHYTSNSNNSQGFNRICKTFDARIETILVHHIFIFHEYSSCFQTTIKYYIFCGKLLFFPYHFKHTQPWISHSLQNIGLRNHKYC